MSERNNLGQEVNQALKDLLSKLSHNESIKAYQKINSQIQNHAGLLKLSEDIKTSQKQVVNLNHYEKVIAEQLELDRLNKLQKELDEHPLVMSYRYHLNEADDLLQYIVKKIEYDVNQNIEQAFQFESSKGSENDATKD